MNESCTVPEGVLLRRLDNGFTIAMEHLPHLHSAAFGLWIRTGSADELPDESGVAHFLEHLFFKGTATRSVRQIMEAIESRGGYINASTSREYTNLYARMLTRHVPAGIEIIADIAKNSLFCEMEKERGVILEEIASTEDNPDELIHDLITEYHWPDHPLGRPIAGSAESVSALTRDDVAAFFQRWYKPENMVFSIAGNFDGDAVLEQIEREFGGLPPAAPPPPCAGPRFQAGVSAVVRPVSQAHVCLAFSGVPVNDERRYVSGLMANVLGGGSTSRLFEKIREDEGLAYSIYAYHYNHIATGMIGVYQGVAPGNCALATGLVFDEIRRLCDEEVPADELEMNREQIKGSLLMSLESPGTRASRIAKGLLFLGRVPAVEEITAKFDAVTAGEVRDFARGVFRRENCALMTLGPDGGAPFAEVPLP